MTDSQNKKDVYKERERYRQKAFLMMLEVGVIIAIPAFVALFLGQYLDKNSQVERNYTLILLFLSFILSWAIIIRKYIVFSKKAKEVDEKIINLKEK
jgi:ABC-type anion transport system duplicated permease subunit